MGYLETDNINIFYKYKIFIIKFLKAYIIFLYYYSVTLMYINLFFLCYFAPRIYSRNHICKSCQPKKVYLIFYILLTNKNLETKENV